MMNEGLLRRTLLATLPLFIWGGHFFAAYLLVAAQCSPALISPGMPARALLLGLSAAALAACLLLAWRCPKSPDDLYGWARLGACVLGTIGVVLTSVPVLMVSGCG
jgi:hypothetical protein